VEDGEVNEDGSTPSNLIMCNKRPGLNAQTAENYVNQLPDGERSLYPGSSFRCLSDLKVPSDEELEAEEEEFVESSEEEEPEESTYTESSSGMTTKAVAPIVGDPMSDGKHKKVGDVCSQEKGDPSCGDSQSWCCGVATKGLVNFEDTDTGDWNITTRDAPNLVICNVMPNVNGKGALRFNATYVSPDNKTMTAFYPGEHFYCLAGAQALLASSFTALIGSILVL